VTGILQGCLLVMCITWEMRDRAERKMMDERVVSRGRASGLDEQEDDEDGERRPLLANGD